MFEGAGDLDGRIGARVRALRLARNLTLDDLARAAEVSRAMLSRVERGESSPTAQLLARICRGLGITLAVLFAQTEAPASPLARRADQPTWRDPATHYLRRSVSPAGTGAAVDIVEVEFPAGGSIALDNLRLAGVHQHVWVLDGILEMTVGEETYRLETGDCLAMRLDRPVAFHNPSAATVRYAVILDHGGSQ